jgi:hypothetical protein
MKIIETTALSAPSGLMNLSVDAGVAPGLHRVVLVIEEAPLPEAPKSLNMEDWPVHDIGKWPEGFTVRREDLYGDDGR